MGQHCKRQKHDIQQLQQKTKFQWLDLNFRINEKIDKIHIISRHFRVSQTKSEIQGKGVSAKASGRNNRMRPLLFLVAIYMF